MVLVKVGWRGMNVHRLDGSWFGWVTGGDLYTKLGRHVGRLRRHEVFGQRGQYMGELRDGRLIVDISKIGKNWVGFSPSQPMIGAPTQVTTLERLSLPDGFDDFPTPDSIR